MLGTDGDADEVLGGAGADLLLIGELLVGGAPGARRRELGLNLLDEILKGEIKFDLLNSKSLGVTNVGKVGDELEAIDNLAAGVTATLNTEAEDTAEAALEVLLGVLVRRMALKTGVRDPRDVRVLLEPLGKSGGVLSVALGPQAEGLETEEELLSTEGVEAGAEVTEDLNTGADGEGDGAEGLPELEAVVTLGRLDELGEAGRVLAPVELAAVDNDTGDGSAVAADPLGGGVDDDIGTMLNGSDEVATGTEGVVNLRHIAECG